MKFRKKKEDIQKQILLNIKYYRHTKGITLFDKSKNLLYEKVNLESDELAVVLIKFSRKRRVLLTTKNIYYLNKNNVQKIIGENIERFDYMEHINGEKIIKEKSILEIFFLKKKMFFRVGTYRIVEKNDSYVDIKIWKTNYADCLNDAIKKLKFVGTKYEAI